jgi:hypothetical protein
MNAKELTKDARDSRSHSANQTRTYLIFFGRETVLFLLARRHVLFVRQAVFQQIWGGSDKSCCNDASVEVYLAV